MADSDEWKHEHLERCPRRLCASREDFLRDYPRHHVAGDTVHELLSEIDALRADVERERAEVARMKALRLSPAEHLALTQLHDETTRCRGKLSAYRWVTLEGAVDRQYPKYEIRDLASAAKKMLEHDLRE